jgi:phage recombination protein Bet
MSEKKESLFERFAGKYMFSSPEEMKKILKATAFRQKEKKNKDGTKKPSVDITDAQLYALLIIADEHGLNPFTKEIYAYPDGDAIVPVVGVDGWTRLVNQHADMDGMEFVESTQIVHYENDKAKPCPAWIECVIYRKSRNHPTRIKVHLDEFYRAPFTGFNNSNEPYIIEGTWQKYTKHMLLVKAIVHCSRFAFGFVGFHDPDDAERIIEGQAEVIKEDIDLDSYQPPAYVQKQMAALLDKVSKSGAYQSAIEYVNSLGYSPIELQYAINQIEMKRASHQQVNAQLTQDDATQHQPNN